MVSATTGVVDLKHAFPEWIPAKQHYMVAALTQVKKIFYMKEFPYPQVPNPEAQALFQVNMVKSFRDDSTALQEYDAAIVGSSLPFDLGYENQTSCRHNLPCQNDKRAFLERVENCVRESQEHIYDNEEGSSLRFTEPKPAHVSYIFRVDFETFEAILKHSIVV